MPKKRLRGLPVRYHDIQFGDIWLRDTAPLLRDKRAVRFGFNGWGRKYVLDHDDAVSTNIAKAAGLPTRAVPWILEGGSIEVDGQGTCLTTEQCLLNPNRNPDMTRAQIENGLRETIGATKVLWLKDGLLNDHTDGHIDTIARFVAPGKVLCMESRGPRGPESRRRAQIAATCLRCRCTRPEARGRLRPITRRGDGR